MRIVLAAAMLAAWAPALRAEGDPGAAPGVSIEEKAVYGFHGDYGSTSTELFVPSPKRAYRLSARVKAFRYGAAFRGTSEEYSGALRRELYHVSLGGRLGAQPPSAERSGYHLAYGEALFTFYGGDLGPEHPELAPVVWESTETAPAAASFDRTWITRVRGRYTNTDHHIEFGSAVSGGVLVVVQNSWQFDFSETWQDSSFVAFHWGFDRYNRLLPNNVLTVFLNNVDYAGGGQAIRGWPNNHVGAEISQRIMGDLKLSGGATRLDLLDNQLAIMYSAGLDWSPGEHWRVGASYYHLRRRGIETREAGGLSAAYAW